MRVLARLVFLSWRRAGGQRAVLVLTAAGVAASVVLALLAVSVAPALSARSDRIAWHAPEATTSEAATAVQRSIGDRVGDDPVTRVDLAPVAGRAAVPAPPGAARAPAAGELVVSPAMDRRLADPSSGLVGRYPGEVVAVLGPEGLAHADELVVVVGREAGALTDPDPVAAGDRWVPPETPVAISGFRSTGVDADLELYRVLAQVAAVLLVVPTLLLVGAAARLTAAQREQRLAVLRLAGASPGAVVGLTAVEVAGAALVGAIVGVTGYLAVLPTASHVTLAGGPFGPGDLRLATGFLLATLVLVPAAAAASAVVALRAVVVGPLGVRRRSAPRRPGLWRFATVPVCWAVFGASALSMSDGGSPVGALVGLAAVVATLAVVGPWITWTLGLVLTAVARGPGVLVAGRRLRSDPRGAYRTVSGMVLAGLIAGFLCGVLPTIEAASLDGLDPTELTVRTSTGSTAEVGDAIGAADPGATVRTGNPIGGDPEVEVVVSSPERLDAVRTAVGRADAGAVVEAWGDQVLGTRLVLDDLGRASMVMALAALAMAVAATLVSGTSSILDQRVTLARLRLVGTPVAVLQRARRWHILVPLVAASVGAMASGAVAGITMMVAFGATATDIEAPDLMRMGVLAVAAVVAGALVVALTRPVLVVTTRSALRDEAS